MEKCIIRIELLSDMCVSDGGSYNTLVDTDLCYDRYGFPYIPAKRIRGCLRECALELNDWGDTIPINILFGDKGKSSNSARLRLSNAYLENHDEYRSFVVENRNSAITHPQNVLSALSYIRMQTSINYETGVVDNGTLRSIRVANKGLVFTADTEVADDMFAELEKCCKVLRHIGVSRTRGLGEVSVSIKRCGEVDLIEHAPLVSDATELTYQIDLLEPVICKSINGGESNTLDYIEGSKILGLISQYLKTDYLDFMSKGLFRSLNAYIAKGEKRFTEVPGYIYSVKNDDSRYVNKLSETDENRQKTKDCQLNQMKHRYGSIVDGELDKFGVITEDRNHHTRPDDKSIGRARSNKKGDADFYQMSSIAEGQSFIGKLTGAPEQIAEVYEVITGERVFYIGYSKSSEYGKVRIKVLNTGISKSNSYVMTDSVIAKLNSPAIVYSDRAMPSTNPDDLIAEILSSLNISATPKSIDMYIRNTTLGGYNVTWNMRKPTIVAFEKGSAIRINFNEEVEIPHDEIIMIGERTSEGYGETLITAYYAEDNPYIGNIVDNEEIKPNNVIDASARFPAMLVMPLLDSYIRKRAVVSVSKNREIFTGNKKTYRPTVANMLLMCKNASDLEEVKAIVEGRYDKKLDIKKEKKDAAKFILRNVEEVNSVLDEFLSKNNVTNLDVDINDLKMRYLREYLTQVKYIIREGGK